MHNRLWWRRDCTSTTYILQELAVAPAASTTPAMIFCPEFFGNNAQRFALCPASHAVALPAQRALGFVADDNFIQMLHCKPLM